MVKKNAKCVLIREIVSLYADSNRIAGFRQNIRFSSTRHKKYVILDPCSKKEMVNMATLDGLFVPYFYLQLYVIHESGVLIPFMPFELNFLVTANVAPSHITSNVWTIIRIFNIFKGFPNFKNTLLGIYPCFFMIVTRISKLFSLSLALKFWRLWKQTCKRYIFINVETQQIHNKLKT